MQGGEVLACHSWIRREIKKITAVQTALAGAGVTWDKQIRPLPFPEGHPLPGVGFSLLSGSDFTTIGENRLFSTMLWHIVAITKEDTPLLAGTMAAAIDAALNEQENTDNSDTAWGSVWSVERTAPVYMPVLAEDGGIIFHIGGLYEFVAR
jgi:hypothetical protein